MRHVRHLSAAVVVAAPVTLTGLCIGGALVAAEPTIQEIGGFVSLFAYFVVFVGGVLGICVAIKELRKKPVGPLDIPQPLGVRMVETLVTKDELQRVDGEAKARANANAERMAKVETDFRNQMVEMREYLHKAVHDQGQAIQGLVVDIRDSNDSQRAAIVEVNKQGEVRIGKVHDRLDVIVRDVGGLEATAKSTADGVVRLQQSLENVLGRLPVNRGVRS